MDRIITRRGLVGMVGRRTSSSRRDAPDEQTEGGRRTIKSHNPTPWLGETGSISLIDYARRVGGAGTDTRKLDCDKESLDQLHQEGFKHVPEAVHSALAQSNASILKVRWPRSVYLMGFLLVDEWLWRSTLAMRYLRAMRTRWDACQCLRTSQSLLQLSQLELMSQICDTGVTRAVSWTKEGSI